MNASGKIHNPHLLVEVLQGCRRLEHSRVHRGQLGAFPLYSLEVGSDKDTAMPVISTKALFGMHTISAQYTHFKVLIRDRTEAKASPSDSAAFRTSATRLVRLREGVNTHISLQRELSQHTLRCTALTWPRFLPGEKRRLHVQAETIASCRHLPAMTPLRRSPHIDIYQSSRNKSITGLSTAYVPHP
jgi:hypothetical protein